MCQDGPGRVTRSEAYRLLIAEVYELAGVSRHVSEDLARQQGQTAARWHVLSVLSEGPRTVSSIARRLGLARQSVRRVVDDLAAGGQVQRWDNPDHRRAALVALTSCGSTTLQALICTADTERHDSLQRSGLSQDDLLHARETLRRLLTTLRKPNQDPTPPSPAARPVRSNAEALRQSTAHQ